MRGMALALIAAGCAHARTPDASRLGLRTAPRATARVGAARLDLWIANEGPSPRPVVVDPEALLVAVTSTSGHAVPCRPPSTAELPTIRLLAAGERASVQLDLSRRCEIAEPGEYRVEIEHPAGDAKATVDLRVTRWTNPGPLSPGQAGPPSLP